MRITRHRLGLVRHTGGCLALAAVAPVAVADLGFPDPLAVLSAWGPCPDCPEDLDADGTVGFEDLLTVLSDLGPCSP